MYHAALFVANPKYRKAALLSCPEDRPLVIQFAANTARDFVAAARLAEPFVDAVDLNLGCPQRDARLGHFGSYLLGREDWPVVAEMVREASRVLAIPICICLSGGAANDGNGGNDDGPLRSDCWGGSENRGMLISG